MGLHLIEKRKVYVDIEQMKAWIFIIIGNLFLLEKFPSLLVLMGAGNHLLL